MTYTYQIIIHPFDGGNVFELSPFDSPGNITETIREISAKIAARRPLLDLGDRVEVKTDNPQWKNSYRGAVGEWIPSVLHKAHPFAAFDL